MIPELLILISEYGEKIEGDVFMELLFQKLKLFIFLTTEQLSFCLTVALRSFKSLMIIEGVVLCC